MDFEPNVNTGLRGSGGQRRQKHKDGASIHYIMRFVTLYSVSLVKSVTLEKGILIHLAQPQEKFLAFCFSFSFSPDNAWRPSHIYSYTSEILFPLGSSGRREWLS